MRWLLAQGADANAQLPVPGVDHPLPVLYGATAHAGDGETVRALLAAGADPAARRDAEMVALLLAHGAPVPRPEPHWPDDLATVAEQAAA